MPENVNFRPGFTVTELEAVHNRYAKQNTVLNAKYASDKSGFQGRHFSLF